MVLRICIALILLVCALAPARADPVETLRGCVAAHTVSRAEGLAVYRRDDLPDDTQVMLHGSIGWHVTWAVILDPTKDPIQAWDTVPSETGLPLFRKPVGPEIRTALDSCGAVFMGPWPGDWPKAAPQALPSLSTLPGDELLPSPR